MTAFEALYPLSYRRTYGGQDSNLRPPGYDPITIINRSVTKRSLDEVGVGLPA